MKVRVSITRRPGILDPEGKAITRALGDLGFAEVADVRTGKLLILEVSAPLHPAGKPGTSRADHLKSISIPQLFLSGTHDRLADLTLLRGVVTGLKQAKIHELDTADHSFRILKRSRESAEDVYKEVARVTAEFAETVTGR